MSRSNKAKKQADARKRFLTGSKRPLVGAPLDLVRDRREPGGEKRMNDGEEENRRGNGIERFHPDPLGKDLENRAARRIRIERQLPHRY